MNHDELLREIEKRIEVKKFGQIGMLKALIESNRVLANALDGLNNYAANIEENHKDACVHGAGYSLLGQLAQQTGTDACIALAKSEEILKGVV